MRQIKIKYRYQILLYFSLMLVCISLGFSYVLVQKEKSIKMDRLIFQMQPYTNLIYNYICKDSPDISGLVPILPKDMRITVIDTNGQVLYDNFSKKGEKLENHMGRPELKDAKGNGWGTALRFSETLKSEYLYYVKKYPRVYIRTALDYKTSVLPLLRSDNKFLISISIIFILVLVVFVYLSRQINKPISSLKEFIDKVQQGKGDYDKIRFPDNEFGDVGEQIIQTFRQLESTKKYKQQLAHNVAHELKTPLTGIRGYLETLLQQENIDPQQRKFFLERAYAQTIRLSAIIEDISVLNKIEEAADKFEIEQINIRQCIKEIESDLSFKLEEKNIEFIIKVGENLVIEGIYVLIYSLFKNLIDNSIEHGGENIEICIENTSCDEKFAYFTYSDTGKGVPENHLGRIFERFYRVEAGRSRKSGGSGLGLSIVRNAVSLHKGIINVKNGEKRGLIFEFSLSINEVRHQSGV